MPNLLCITPSPGLKTGYGRIPGNLLPRWQHKFNKIGMVVTRAPQEGCTAHRFGPALHLKDQEEPTEAMQAFIKDEGPWTHVWMMGTLDYLHHLVYEVGISSASAPNSITYAYAIIDSPFVDPKHYALAAQFDFFIAMSDMAAGAYKNALLSVPSPNKLAYKAVQSMGVIPPGVDTNIFKPLNVHAGDYGKEEIRQAMFNGKVTGNDLLLMSSGRHIANRGYPAILGAAKRLQELKPDTGVKLYIHTHAENQPVLRTLADGIGLKVGTELWFNTKGHISDTQMNWLYNAADVYLNCSTVDGWSFSLTEAMAAGCIVAAPAEHIWLDLVDNGRGIAVPTTQFSMLSPETFARSVTSDRVAEEVANLLGSDDEQTVRETGMAYAHLSTELSWDRIATGWLALFGMDV